MVEDEPHELYFSRDTDHLGFLEKQLKDLAGFATLTHELIQNADDAGASWIEFRVDRDALRIANGGVFSDCNRQEEEDCPWLADPSQGRRCDFHRLRRVASGDKRQEAGTTGAFGVGLISVYQITDRPEVISSGRHWIIDETLDAARRIRACGGCSTCRSAHLPPTLFVLPWATDARTSFRIRTRSAPFPTGGQAQLKAEIKDALPTALLFLQHLNQARLWADGEELYSVQRLVEGSTILVEADGEARLWQVLRGDFEGDAAELRARYPTAIEAKRRAAVLVAVPTEGPVEGVLCAYLPTQDRTGMPFHVNADFIPTSDRRHVQFDGEIARAWNGAAVRAAARTLAHSLGTLKESLAPDQFWRILDRAFVVRSGTAAGKEYQSAFWIALEPLAREHAVVRTADGRWVKPVEAVQHEKELDPLCRADLERLSLAMVHGDLQSYFNVLGALGVGRLTRTRYLEALRSDLDRSSDGGASNADVDSPTSQVGRWWQSGAARERVWHTVAFLPHRTGKADDVERQLARTLPLVECRDGSTAAFDECWVVEEEIGAILERVLPGLPLAAAAQPEPAIVVEYGDVLGVSELVGQLEQDVGELVEAYERDPEAVHDLLRWLAGRNAEFRSDDRLVARLRELPMFPSARSLRPLSKLSLPGDFQDHLGIAGLVDVKAVEGLHDFLDQLGARPLGVVEYAREHVPHALATDGTTTNTRREVVALLAARLGELRDAEDVLNALRQTLMVECSDGVWRRPSEVYFASAAVAAALGDHVAVVGPAVADVPSLLEFYRWLGVADTPRSADLLGAVLHTAAGPSEEPARARMGQLLAALVTLYEAGSLEEQQLVRLRSTRWLPGKRDRANWHLPRDVYASFQEYLFASEAEFLDVPLALQQRGSRLLGTLGVPDTPTVQHVARHLLQCARKGADVNPEVYTFLARAVDNGQGGEIVALLRQQPILQVAPGRWVSPRVACWEPHTLGRARVTLDVSWRRHQALLDILGVRARADASDAVQVLQDLSREFGSTNRILTDEDKEIVTAAWRILSAALENAEIAEGDVAGLHRWRVAPSPQGHLVEPTSLLFADRTDLELQFARLRQFFIVRDPSTARALLSAGVRPIRSAIHARVTSGGASGEDVGLTALLRERYPALLQVAAATLPSAATARELREVVRSIRCVKADRIEVIRELELGGRRFPSTPTSERAAWSAAEGLMTWVPTAGARARAALTRELAVALDPDGELTGPLAAGFSEALWAATLNEAHEALEAFGYPRVTVSTLDLTSAAPAAISDQPAEPSPAGAGEDVQGAPDEDVAEPEVREPEGPQRGERKLPHGQPRQATRKEEGPSQDRSVPPPELPESLEDPETRPYQGPDPRPASADTSSSADAPDEAETVLPPDAPAPDARRDPTRAIDQTGAVRPQRRYTATVYVEPRAQSALDVDGNGANPWERRLETDAAGVALVLAHERIAGRNPVEMPHSNAGYDVESRDADGGIVRYIEVKSTSDAWGIRGVVLSPVQLDHAREKGDRYWIYVVERAGSPDARILQVQDPFAHIEQFAFDESWRALATSASESGRETPGRTQL